MSSKSHSLTQGAVSPRPQRNRSQSHAKTLPLPKNPGVHGLSAFAHRTQRFQPLPPPLGEPPYHFDLESAVPGISDKAKADGKLVFHCVGDTGGIKNPDYQSSVAKLMKGDLIGANPPSFFYHLGDVVYYNGEPSEYYAQFYEPYNHYDAPILAIPGNHDGDPVDSSQTSLDGWVKYFMTPAPVVNADSFDAPRVTLSLPNVYFTVVAPYATIVGMYTNVPEHGSIDSVQLQWLANEFATAPKNKALILALHHPIYSFDDHHSGSTRMADAVQHAINDSRRVPNLVLTAHVHNYQRIEKEVVQGQATPFLVAGGGGYYHLHGLNSAEGASDPVTGAILVKANDFQHSYMTLTVDKKRISGVVTTIDSTKAQGEPQFDKFDYPADAIELEDGAMVSL